MLSIVITAHNEGHEVRQTIDSVRQKAGVPYEIVLIDDGSTDGSCDELQRVPDVRLIRHDVRRGVARSRDEASRLANGEVLAYLDAHQRIEGDSLRRCADLALERMAIVSPDISGFDSDERSHGAYFSLCRERRFLTAVWKHQPPRDPVARISSLKAPAYFVPRSLYPVLCWSPHLQGWGGSEAAISLKAFFLGIDILHFCGPLIRHQFKRTFHYDVSWPEIWRNQAMIARICFDDRTWHDYWLPEVFEKQIGSDVKAELESAAVINEHHQFLSMKARHDSEFWTRLVYRKIPEVLL